MLYLIATPIGNLADFSFRAVETLKTCDYVLCEDTRYSRILLEHYGIKTPLKSFHSFNEASSEERIIADLKEGKRIALISDAGTPLISDPGHTLAVRCQQEGIPLSALPGPCALIDALILSGFPAIPFQFLGFLPKKAQELRQMIAHALVYPGTTAAYETPHRIEETLAKIAELAPQRELCVARELTKKYEECLRGNAMKLQGHFEEHPPRGEMVLLISPLKENSVHDSLSLKERVERLQEDLGLSKGEAIKMAAQMLHLPKREVYKEFLNE